MNIIQTDILLKKQNGHQNGRRQLTVLATIAGMLIAWSGAVGADHDDHAGHAHEKDKHVEAVKDHDDHDDHAGHAHEEGKHVEPVKDDDDHAGHAHGDEEAEAGLTLSPMEQRHAGIVIATAGPGGLAKEIRLPGEVVLNRDRVVHVVPQVTGITREIKVTEGDLVAAGQVLATLSSGELGEAKLDYLTKINEIFCCNILVPRAKAVHDNTLKLLKFLDGNPALEDLQGFGAGEVGENLMTLIEGYAELVQSRQAFTREQGLYQKKISSEQDYLTAKTEFEKAAARYRAGRDSAAFEVRHELFEAEANLRTAKFAARTAEQRLRIMGLAATDIHQLDGLVLPEQECQDPGCTDCKPGLSAAERERLLGDDFTRYEIQAPIAGRIVERHLSPGEKVESGADIFTVADTSTVWAELAVHLKDFDTLRVGEEVTIQAEHSGNLTRGRIAMLSPTVNRETRTATARVAIDNADGAWRPGIFVIGRISVAVQQVPVVVPKQAVQVLEGRQVVFILDGNAFEPVAVQTGRLDSENIEITSGLAPGTPFVSKGAFELKAKLVTSNLDSHAGHGH